MATKYEPLEFHLRAIPSHVREVTIPFSDLTRILGTPLPSSAFEHRPWWGNQKESKSRPQAHAWLAAGFLVDTVNQGRSDGWVRFTRK